MGQRLLVVSQCFYPEPFRINDLCAEWVRRGYDVTVVTSIPNYPQGDYYEGYGLRKRRREKHAGIRILRLPVIPRKKNKICLLLNYISFLVSGLIWAHGTKRRFDRVFIFETSPMTQALVGTAAAKRMHIPCELYVQDLWPDNVEVVAGVKNPAILSVLDRMCDRIYRDSTRILVTSPSFAQTLAQRGVPKSKLLYWPQYAEDFYQPLDRDKIRRAAKTDPSAVTGLIPEDDSFTLIFTGNIGVAQGLEILPETARILKKQAKTCPVRFVIVGDGRARESFQKAIRKKGVSACFTLIPRQPAEIIPELFACCDAAFLSFMDNELFARTIPAKLQSYLACGMPVIASAAGETKRVITEADAGWCCPLGDARALAETIRTVAMKAGEDDHRELKQRGQNALKYSREHFNKQMLLAQLEKLWAERDS
ncbi:MAG: glycosyltransferase family 4 protein [Lachnospiraceae bacterium]|nr:glycosyltransferase family 4 protein [Lachnospiraceae bacterium]